MARQSGFAPNTIKAYARGLAQWWTYLETELEDLERFESTIRQLPRRRPA